MSRVFHGSTNASIFEDFIEELLQHCGKWPEPKSVLVMDNASFHHSERIEQMCSQAEVKLLYLPPYTPDLNPIEELFSELRPLLNGIGKLMKTTLTRDLIPFLNGVLAPWVHGNKVQKGTFRNAGITLDDYGMEYGTYRSGD